LNDPAPAGTPAQAAAAPAARLLTHTFLLTWLATFALCVSYFLLLPTIPLYAAALGGTQSQIGLVLGLYAGASTLVRPCVAPAVDRRGRKPFIVAGAIISLVACLLYFVAAGIPPLFLVRVVHGCGAGIFMTAATALVADVAPVPRRGEAMGTYGLAFNVAMAFAPAAGMAVVNRASFAALFAVCTAVTVAALALSATVPGGPGATGPAAPPDGQPATGAQEIPAPAGRGHLLSRPALFPSAIMVAQTIAYGAVLSFVPIWGQVKRLDNPGTVFTAFALAMLAVRTRAGRLSDRFGRGAVIVPGLLIVSTAMILLAIAGQPWHLQAAGAVLGLGMGAVQPSLGAFLTDRAPDAERARAFAIFYGAFELGIAVGSVGFGWFLEAATFPAMWLTAAVAPALGAIAYCAGAGRRLRARAPARAPGEG